MKKYFFGALFLLFFFAVFSQNIRVGLLTNHSISSINFSSPSGNYFLYADGKLLDSIDKSTDLAITAEKDSFEIHSSKKNYGIFFKIVLKADSTQKNIFFKLKFQNLIVTEKKYEGDLEITEKASALQLVNVLGIEKYLAGVVESEAGRRKNREYYKVQAIICRTYVLSNLGRHQSDGFDLCDEVHCQAYNGMSTDTVISNAINATKGLVLVDNNSNLIVAAFHSNCGGETLNSEDVWALPTTYLKSVKDTFCIHQPNAHWRKMIPEKAWQNYMNEKQKNNFSNTYDSLKDNNSLYYNDNGIAIPTRIIRADWHLKSAFFTLKNVNDSVIELDGKGYGHRVGLCQEGAMEMTKLGYSYLQILHFYYTNVTIVNRSSISFFKDNQPKKENGTSTF
ncbi:MAG: SpoIID/LytB domain-containing protein [Bacteroidia bacterium]